MGEVEIIGDKVYHVFEDNGEDRMTKSNRSCVNAPK